ncbi:MAG: hypothetical protein II309_05845, partial [Bacilli bacterium]|nr:hypothetical protein [Bacilli bacterium]
TVFIKDGMLSEAELVTDPEGQIAGKYIKLTWNTDAGKQDMYVPVNGLVDVYTADETYLTVANNQFSHKTSGVAAGTYATNTADVTVDSTTEKSFKVPTLTVDAAGHVTAASEKTVTIKLPDSIDTAVQTVSGNDYVSATKYGTNVSLRLQTQTMAGVAAEGAEDGLATALDVKEYVNTKVGEANTAIKALDVDPFSLTTLNSNKLEGYQISEVDGKIVKGQTAETLLTFASAPTTDNKVATQAEIAALDAEVTSTDDTNVQVKVTEVDGKITAVNVTDNSINATDLSNAIEALYGTATIASVANDVVTLKAGIVETDGVIANNADADITLAKVATTGAAADVTIADAGNLITATNVEGALAEIAAEIDAMDLTATDVVALNEGKTALQAGKISETDGKVAVATATPLVEFNQALTDGNKVATMKDITDAAISGQEAIKVENKVVSLTIDGTDKVLTQGTNGLLANLSLEYDSTNKLIKLLGKTTGEGEAAAPAVIDTIDATVFIKDGMLSEAELVTLTEGQAGEGKPAGEYIKLTFNADAEQSPIYINVTSLIDVYAADETYLHLEGYKFEHKTITNLDSTNAHGITEDVTVDSTTEKFFKVPTLTVDAAGHVVSVDEKTVTIKLPNSINTAVQTITSTEEINATNKFVVVKATRAGGSNDVVLKTVYQTKNVEGATTDDNGLATALDVKEYVDGKIANVNTAIEALDGTATIASVANDVVTLKAGIVETDGVIDNNDDADITLAKVAKTGAAADVTYTRGSGETATNMSVQAVIAELDVDTWDAGTY